MEVLYTVSPRGIRHLEILDEKVTAVAGVWVVLAINSLVVSQFQLTWSPQISHLVVYVGDSTRPRSTRPRLFLDVNKRPTLRSFGFSTATDFSMSCDRNWKVAR